MSKDVVVNDVRLPSSRRSEDGNEFGRPGGRAITNLDTVLREVDAALGARRGPSVEYLFVAPFYSHHAWALGLGSPFGHAALRFTTSDGKVANTEFRIIANFSFVWFGIKLLLIAKIGCGDEYC